MRGWSGSSPIGYSAGKKIEPGLSIVNGFEKKTVLADGHMDFFKNATKRNKICLQTHFKILL